MTELIPQIQFFIVGCGIYVIMKAIQIFCEMTL